MNVVLLLDTIKSKADFVSERDDEVRFGRSLDSKAKRTPYI